MCKDYRYLRPLKYGFLDILTFKIWLIALFSLSKDKPTDTDWLWFRGNVKDVGRRSCVPSRCALMLSWGVLSNIPLYSMSQCIHELATQAHIGMVTMHSVELGAVCEKSCESLSASNLWRLFRVAFCFAMGSELVSLAATTLSATW
jgi:hypothetical protein